MQKAKFSMMLCALLGLLEGGLVRAQGNPSPGPTPASPDKEVFAMLKSFYTKYIQTFNDYPTDEKRLQPLLKANCDPQLLAKLKKKAEGGDLDSDPFLKAQDVDLRWLKSLEVRKDGATADGYAVSYVDNADKSTVILHLVANKLNGVLKIRDVRLN